MLTVAILALTANVVSVVVLYWTYRAIVDYTGQTKRLANVAVEQADALPRPLILPFTQLNTRGTFSIEGSTLQLTNGGDVPATRIEYEIRCADDSVTRGACAFLKSGDLLETNFATAGLVDGSVIKATYETLSGGVEMEARATIKDKQILRLDVPRPRIRS